MENLENIMSVLQEAQITNFCSFWIRFKKKKKKSNPKLEFPRKKMLGVEVGVCACTKQVLQKAEQRWVNINVIKYRSVMCI